jgi:hypothetical protein
MITSPLTGNMGNNIMSVAITRTVADKNGYQFGFNPHPEFDYHQGMPQLDFLDIDYGYEHDYKYGDKPHWIDYFWSEQYETIKYPNGDSVDYHPYQPDVFDVRDGTKITIRCMQDARYYDREKLRQWFAIKEEKIEEYKTKIKYLNISLDNDLTVINCRGGEYKSVPHVLLQKKYWDDAMNIMRDRNHKMRFLCVTDDVEYGNQLFDFKIPVVHLDIGGDYFLVNNSKNLIISNSSFAIFPTWLNNNNPFVIAPFGWARHNCHQNYWASSDIWTFPWNFLDRDGEIKEYK